MSIKAFEICFKCGYQISRSEQAFVYKGDIVCLKCDNKLRYKPKETEDIPNKESKNKDTIQEKGEEDMNVDTVMNNSGIAIGQSPIEDKLEISDSVSKSDSDNKTLFKGTDIKEEDMNDSFDLTAANLNTDDNKEINIQSTTNSKTNCQQVQIQLPSFLHSCFIDRDFSTIRPRMKKNYRSVGGFVILLCIVAIVAVGTVLVTRYLL